MPAPTHGLPPHHLEKIQRMPPTCIARASCTSETARALRLVLPRKRRARKSRPGTKVLSMSTACSSNATARSRPGKSSCTRVRNNSEHRPSNQSRNNR